MNKYHLLIILTILSITSTLYIYFLYTSEKDSIVALTEKLSYYNDSLHTYVNMYPSSSFESLKKENEQLYNELKEKDELIEAIKFTYKYNFDSTEKVIGDSIQTDSLYHISVQNDTIGYDLKVWASNFYKYRLLFNLTNDFTISRQKFGDINKTEIVSQLPGTIENVTNWTKKDVKKKFVVGPSVGFGYGFLNKNFDIFVGGTITWYLW